MKFINRLDIFIITIIGLGMVVTIFQPGFPILAADNSITSVSVPPQPVNSGQQFSISVNIQLNSPIAGAQFNLSFNPSLVIVNNITEGNLFSQNGASTYFLAGTVNNTAGTITGVAGAIIGSGKNVSTSGSLAVINITARATSGTCALNLNNVIIADANGQSVPVNLVNGQVVINGTTTTTTTTIITTTMTTTTTVSPAPPSGGSGGSSGGGGGGPSVPTSVTGVMDVSNIVNAHGVFSLSVSPWSDDKKVVMVVNGGTTVTTLAGAPLTQISIQHLTVAPTFPVGAGIASLGYNILPSEAKISPSSVVRFQYDPTLIPPDVLESSLQVAYYDTVLNKWVSLPSEVDTNNHFITAQISCFYFYAVTYGVKNTEQVLITSTTSTPSTTTTQTTSTVTTTTSALTTSSSASTTTTKTMPIALAVIPVSTPAGTITTAAPRVVRMSLLAVTIGIDAILIIVVVIAILLIRRSLLKNRQGK